MEKSEIIDLMEESNFTLWATLGGNKLQFMTAHDQYVLPVGINCIINPSTQDFEFMYRMSGSNIQLVSTKCSPFTNNKHFNKILTKFVDYVNKLENK